MISLIIWGLALAVAVCIAVFNIRKVKFLECELSQAHDKIISDNEVITHKNKQLGLEESKYRRMQSERDKFISENVKLEKELKEKQDVIFKQAEELKNIKHMLETDRAHNAKTISIIEKNMDDALTVIFNNNTSKSDGYYACTKLQGKIFNSGLVSIITDYNDNNSTLARVNIFKGIPNHPGYENKHKPKRVVSDEKIRN